MTSALGGHTLSARRRRVCVHFRLLSYLILRHGDPAIPYFWSHHDKHVTIDQEVAFLGGVDITFGRYEDSEYLLRDENSDVTEMKFPGADYANPR